MASIRVAIERSLATNATVAVLFALPTALALRSTPQAVFWPEFLLAAVLVGAFAACYWRGAICRVPLAPLFPCALSMIWMLATWGLSSPPFVVGFLAYLLLFAVAATLAGGADMRLVATAMLAVALVQSFIGAMQLFDVSLGGAVLPKVYRQAYGNVGQPNHYAALLSLGLAAVVGGAGDWRWPRWLTVSVVVWLSVSIAASASRAPWFYMLCFILLGFWGRCRGSLAGRDAARRAIWVGVAALAIQIAFAYSGCLDWLGVTSSIARASDAGSNGQRLYDWSLALSAVKSSPWGGLGIGGFHGWAVAQMPVTPPVPFSKFAEHAHNLPLHLAATMGLPFAVLLLGTVAWWLFRQLRVPMASNRLFALCSLAVVGLHSLVEYPLWYSYFMIPAGMFCGVLVASAPRGRMIQLSPWMTRAFAIVLVLALVWVARDYLIVQRAHDDWATVRGVAAGMERERIRKEVAHVSDWSIFGDHARSLALQTWTPAATTAAQMVAQCEPAFRLRPSWGLGTQCLLAMGMAGDRQGVARMSLVLCEGFPRHHGMLREWAEEADRYHPAVSVQSESCLRKS